MFEVDMRQADTTLLQDPYGGREQAGALNLMPEVMTPDSLLGLTLAEAERRLIEATLAQHRGSIPKAARVLDVSPSTLYRKIEAWSAKAS